MYLGLNKQDGRAIHDLDHILQSIADIVLTPIGSRLERREYGSFIAELIDQPVNPATIQLLRAATVTAILRWEDRVAIDKVSIELEGPKVGMHIDGRRTDLPTPQKIHVWLPFRANTP